MTAGKRPVTRVLGYLRVSTEEQAANGNGLDAQRATITAEADRRGWTVDLVADEGASGKHVNTGLRSCLDQLAQGRADALIVAKLDRMARSVLHAADILQLARTQGWDLVICDLGVDLSTHNGRLVANVLASVAEWERDHIGQRTREGLAAARARGVRIGRPRLAPAVVVDRIVNNRERGESYGSIARTLTDERILSPQGRSTWQASTVRRIYIAAMDQGELTWPSSASSL